MRAQGVPASRWTPSSASSRSRSASKGGPPMRRGRGGPRRHPGRSCRRGAPAPGRPAGPPPRRRGSPAGRPGGGGRTGLPPGPASSGGSSASRAAKGSSSRRSSGSRTSARARATRWASPPESVPGQASASARVRPRPARPRRVAGGRPPGQPEHHVAPDLHGGHEPRLLVDDGAHLGHQHVAGGRRLEPGQNAQQRGLAAARRAEQRHEFPSATVTSRSCSTARSPKDLPTPRRDGGGCA